MSGRSWGTSVRDRWQIDERPGQRRPSVDVELVALRVFHRDCVVVEAFRVQDADEQGTEIGQAARLRVDALPAGLDRDRAAAADTDIEVQPVLGRFAIRYHLEPDPRPATAGIDDAVRAVPSSSSGTPRSRQYASQLAKPSGGGLSSYPSAAAQKRASGSGSAQSITSWKLTAIGLPLGAGNVSPPACRKALTPARARHPRADRAATPGGAGPGWACSGGVGRASRGGGRA